MSARPKPSFRRRQPWSASAVAPFVALAVTCFMGAVAVFSVVPAAIVSAAPTNPYAALTVLDGSADVDDHVVTPDGMWVVYRTVSSELRSVPAAGGSVRTLATVRPERMEVAPDSSAVAFVGSNVLRSVPVAGGPATTLFTATGTAKIGKIGWMAGSRDVWFMSDSGTSAGSERLWVVPAVGGTAVLLTPDTAVDSVSSSPDGRMLAFDRLGSLYTVPVDGSRAPTRRNAPLTGASYVNGFHWTHDATRLLYQVMVSMVIEQSWSVPAESGDATLLGPPDGNVVGLQQPGGDRVVVRIDAATGSSIVSMLPDGSDQRVLVGPSAANLVVFDIGRTKVLFGDSANRLFVTSVLGGTPESLGPLPVAGAWLTDDETNAVWQLPGSRRLQAREIPQRGVFAGGRTLTGDDAEPVVDANGHLAFSGGDRPLLYVQGGDLRVADLAATNSNRSIEGTGPPIGTTYTDAIGTVDMTRVVFVAERAGRRILTAAGPDPATLGATVAYRAVTPARVLDTRLDGPQLGYAGGTPVAGQTIGLMVRGRGGVPNLPNVQAVVLNVTLTESAGPGFVTVWPDGSSRPLASSLNVTEVGQTRPNLVTVRLPANGVVNLFTQSGGHLIADVAGYYSDAATAQEGRFFPLAPRRVLDTRADGPQVGASGPKPGAGTQVDLVVAGRSGVAADASAVVLNVTATEASAAGFVTVWPTGVTRPLASNLNLSAIGQTSANQVIVPIGVGGSVSLFTQSGAHLVADVAGWFTGPGELPGTSGLFLPNPVPTRVLDTRPGVAQLGYAGGLPRPGQQVPVVLDARATSAVVANATITEATGAGFVTAWPTNLPRPLASNLNAEGGDTVANQITVASLDVRAPLSMFAQSGGHLVVDLVGRYTR